MKSQTLNRQAHTGQPFLKRHWPRLRRILQIGFVLLVLGLVISEARNVDWQKVLDSMAQYKATDLALVMLMVVGSYGLFMNYDRMAKSYTGHEVGLHKTLLIAFICYTFNFNFGSLIGSAGLRIKLYSQMGVKGPDIARIISFCVLSNWIGYLILTGILLTFHLVPLPNHQYNINNLALRGIGLALLITAIAYIVLCVRGGRSSLSIRGHTITIPTLPVVVQQLLTSITNWLLIGTMVYVLLGKAADYSLILGVFLISSVIGAMTHVPAGLGVLEAVFIVCLAGKVGREDIIAGLLAFRGCFYLLPLCLALPLYIALEWRHRRKQ